MSLSSQHCGPFYSSGGGSSTFITEPYAYREYFDAQGYAPSRTTIYSDSETPTTSYEGRFTTTHSKGGSIYAKAITSAAGLTVDLPSPDSGIGAEAITPRDQNHIQQVNSSLSFSCHQLFANKLMIFFFFAISISLIQFKFSIYVSLHLTHILNIICLDCMSYSHFN